jgi:hypothetical protein
MSILAMAANSKKASRKPLADDAISSIRPQPRQVKINVDAAFPAEISLKEWLVLCKRLSRSICSIG